MCEISFFIGAMLGVVFITRLVLGLISRWNTDIPVIVTANGLSLFIVTILAGFGYADGGVPVFGKAFTMYVVPQFVVLFACLWHWNRRRGREAGKIPPEKPGRWSARSKGIAAAFAIVFVIALVGAIGSTVGRFASDSILEPRMSIVDALKDVSIEINATLRQRLDDVTVLRRTYTEGSTLIYLNELADGFELDSLTAIEASIRSRVCSNEPMLQMLREGVTYAYDYVTPSTGRNWGRVTISSCAPT